MVRKALALLVVVVAVVGSALGVIGLLWPGLADASQHSATRSFSADTVEAGGELTVTMVVSGIGQLGGVVETIPDGWTYMSTSLDDSDVRMLDAENPNIVTFVLFGAQTFTYTVTAPGDAGEYTFSGIVRDSDRDDRDVDGAMMVMASDMSMPMASREFSAATGMPGDSVTVTITASGYGEMGSVAETLPMGFTYMESSLPAGDVTRSGQMVTFNLPADGEMATEFTYTVTASDMAGSYDFMGELTDADDMMHTVGGAMSVMVEAAPVMPVMMEGPRASRTLSPMSLMQGGNIRVTITAMDYGQLGAVVENLPAGFTYVDGSSTLPDVMVEDRGDGSRRLTFTLLAPDSGTFSYTVSTANASVGTHSFGGELIDDHRNSHGVGGDTRVTVQPREMPGAPRAERSFSMSMTGFGDEVTVTIAARNYGQFGAVVETIPMGFTYVMDSSSLPDVDRDGRNLTFALLTPNNATFTYKVMTADTVGDYDFSGNLVDDQQMMHVVAGDSRITAGPTAMRSFSAPSVRTGANLDVMIIARDYGSLGAVVETLPNGFAYVSSDLAYFEEDGNELRFALLDANNSSFSYTVRAPASAGNYDFMGRLIDDAQMSHDVGGDTSVMVEVRATATATARPSRRRPGGRAGAAAVVAGAAADTPRR